MTLSAESRERLARRQAEFVTAMLAVDGRAPESFDPANWQVAATALATKRRRSAARAWPALVESLGDEFEQLWTGFAAAHDLPSSGGPLADGFLFAKWLMSHRPLSDKARRELLSVELQHQPCAEGLKPRRRPTVRVVRLSASRRWVLAARLPWLGPRWWEFSLSRHSVRRPP